MKNSGKITFCAMMAALASVLMATSYFPYLTYGIPALSGLFIMAALIETDVKWALCAYIASCVPVFLIAENEAKLLYIIFFGYYPIVKFLCEKIRSRVVEYLLKFAVFNVAVLLAYCVFATVFSVDLGDMGEFGKYTGLILLLAANFVFVLYDKAILSVSAFYMQRIHPSVGKILRGK